MFDGPLGPSHGTFHERHQDKSHDVIVAEFLPRAISVQWRQSRSAGVPGRSRRLPSIAMFRPATRHRTIDWSDYDRTRRLRGSSRAPSTPSKLCRRPAGGFGDDGRRPHLDTMDPPSAAGSLALFPRFVSPTEVLRLSPRTKGGGSASVQAELSTRRL